MLIHIKRNAEVFGPYSIEEAREYLSAGRLSLSDFAQLPGTTEWIPLGSVPGVRSAPPPPIVTEPTVTAAGSQQQVAPLPTVTQPVGPREQARTRFHRSIYTLLAILFGLLTFFFGMGSVGAIIEAFTRSSGVSIAGAVFALLITFYLGLATYRCCKKTQSAVHQTSSSAASMGAVSYAGFWIRFAAGVIDAIILLPINLLLTFPGANPRLAGFLWTGGEPVTSQSEVVTVQIFACILVSIISWIYISELLSSPWQATVGMKACGLKITDESGNRISFGRATGRWFAMWLSGCPTLFIGFIMIAWTSKKQGLHDLIARTLVVKASLSKL